MSEHQPRSSAASHEPELVRVGRLIAEMVAGWPSPTPEQADRLRRLLASAPSAATRQAAGGVGPGEGAGPAPTVQPARPGGP